VSGTVEPISDRWVASGALLAVTVAVPALWNGGFGTTSRSVFIALAGATLLVAVTFDSSSTADAARSPLALSLTALALLSVLSGTWTSDGVTAAVRTGLVIGGYAAVFVGAYVLTRAAGPWPVAVGIAALAVIEAVLGLRAVAFHSLPDAERIVRAWQPGGTFEYPPALAILNVGALPMFGFGMRHRMWAVAGAGASGAFLAGTTIRLGDSRLGLVLAVVLLAALIVYGARVMRSRLAAAGLAALVVLGALLAPTVLGGDVALGAPGAGARGLAEILGLAVVSGGIWVLFREDVSARRWALTAVMVVTVIAVVASGFDGGRGASEHGGRRVPASRPVAATDVFHGRTHEWLAALQTWLDRPVLGAGADAYYPASLRHQTVAVSRFAHDLPLELTAELGVLGLALGVAIYASGVAIVISARGTPVVWLLGPLVVVFLVSNLVDWTWHLAGLTAVWAAACGALA
jgi:hypothetical protein